MTTAYSPTHHAARLFDPDGNTVKAVCTWERCRTKWSRVPILSNGNGSGARDSRDMTVVVRPRRLTTRIGRPYAVEHRARPLCC